MVEIFSASNLSVLKHMPLVQYASDMKSVSLELRKYGVNYFAYSVMHRDGSREVLSACPEYAELFIREKFYKKAFCGSVDHFRSGYYPFKNLSCPDVFSAMKDCCQVEDGIIVTKCFSNSVDIFYFGYKSCYIDSVEFYLKYFNVLEAFIHGFYEKMYRVLLKSSSKRLIYTDGFGDTTNLTNANYEQESLVSASLQSNSHLYRLKNLALRYKLTKKEFEIARLLFSGYTQKEIAIKIYSSVRTIEKHLLSLREKTNSRSLIHLMSRFIQEC